jgi:hypothetical protein
LVIQKQKQNENFISLFFGNNTKQTDPELQQSKSYLLNACNIFNKNGALQSLLQLQELMKDHARAGLTAIKLFVHTDVRRFEQKIKFLDIAKVNSSTSIFVFGLVSPIVGD